MRKKTEEHINLLISRYPSLNELRADIKRGLEVMIRGFRSGRRLLVCGNGGSASDSLHIVGELMKGFVLRRPIPDELRKKFITSCPDSAEYLTKNLQMPLRAVSLVGETSLLTAYANDCDSDLVFAQEVLGMGDKEDMLLALSTSGNSKNVVYAAEVAHALGLKVIGLLGKDGGRLKKLCDVAIVVPEADTYKIQELHLPIYHAICLALEEEFFGDE